MLPAMCVIANDEEKARKWKICQTLSLNEIIQMCWMMFKFIEKEGIGDDYEDGSQSILVFKLTRIFLDIHLGKHVSCHFLF